MDIPINEQDDVLNPFYYFTLAFSGLHLLVSSLLFVWRRDKFPIKGHNVSLTIFIAAAMTGVTVVDASAGIADAETCTIATSVIYLFGVIAVNMMTAQAVRLWFEYNLAHEQSQLQNLQADIGEAAPAGWFTRKRSHFRPLRLVAIAAGTSLIEVAVAVGIIASLENVAFGVLLRCEEILGVLVVIFLFCVATCGFMLSIFWRFRNKSDGFGLKTMFKQWGIIFFALAPWLVMIELWEAFTDLDYFVEAVRIAIRFLAMQLIVAATLDRPVYLSFHDAGHGGMSSISHVRDEDEDAGDDEDAEPVEQVLNLQSSAAAVEMQKPATGSADSASAAEEAGGGGAADPPVREEAAEVFSSKTLALGIEDILMNPVYAPQLASFTKHLVGEFSVESLLFYFRVLNFQTFVKAQEKAQAGNGAAKRKSKPELSISVRTKKDEDEDEQEHSRFSDSDDNEGEEEADTDSDVVKAADESDAVDVEIAWRALLVYFEFLDRTSLAQINISHRVSDPVRKELEDAVFHFEHLSPSISPDDIELKRPVSTKIFDQAKRGVVELLERDPFVRWRRAIRDAVDKGRKD